MLAAVALTACGGKSASTDSVNAKEVSAGIGVSATVTCHGSACVVAWTEGFHSAAEARFMALPVVAWVSVDPRLRSVLKLQVRIKGPAGRVARFACKLPAAKSGQSRPVVRTAANVRSACAEHVGAGA